MYIKANGSTIEHYPYTLDQLRRDNPETSFPKNMSESQWISFGAIKVVKTTKPTADVVRRLDPIQVNGVWTQQWESRSYTTSEVQEQLESMKESVIDAAQRKLDRVAQRHGYDNIISLCTYATSSVTRYNLEGTYGVALRDATWSALETILAEVIAGTRPMPNSYADIKDDLPTVVWP